MKSFGYCVWLLPETNSPLFKFAKGFTPHISIRTDMKKNEAIHFLKSQSQTQIFKVIFSNYYLSTSEGFHSFEFKANFKDLVPFQIQKNPHVSFIYKYNTDIVPSETKDIIKNVKLEHVYKFQKCIIMHCKGHYSTWKEVTF